MSVKNGYDDLVRRLKRLADSWVVDPEAEGQWTAQAYHECSRALLNELGDHPREDHIKVSYRSVEDRPIGLPGRRTHESTAYLTEDLGGGVWKGTNKHTDEPVTVWWSGRYWWQIPMEDDPG